MHISGTARRILDVPRQGVSTAREAPQQLNHLWHQFTLLAGRASSLVDRVEALLERLESKIDEVDTITDSSRALVARIGEVAERAATVAEDAGATQQQAEQQVRRLHRLLEVYEPILSSLAPAGRTWGSTVKPAHVEGLVALLEELPDLVDMIKPALEGMGQLVPQLHEVTDRMDNVGQVVEGLPGAKALRRRGQAREEAGGD